MNPSRHDLVGPVTAFLRDAGATVRSPAPGEWGAVFDDVGGRPLEVGLRLHGGLLRAQAWVAAAGALDPHTLLHRNRLGVLARYAHSAAGEVHVHAEIPESAAADARELDRMLGALIAAASAVREG